MSLLDDARKLRNRSSCSPRCCDQDDRPCPLHTLEQIVAALEAADLVTIAYEEERIMAGVVRGSQFVAALEALDVALDA